MLNIKNELIYNYLFENPIIKKTEDRYIINEKGKKYNLYELSDEKILEEIYDIINTSPNFLKKRYKIVKNKNNNIWIQYMGKKYYIVENTKDSEEEIERILNENILVIKNYKLTLHNNWEELWQKKNDYIEKLYNLETNSNKKIVELIDYAISMAESAIMYIENEPKNNNKLVVSYKKIDALSMKNPLNITLDIVERNISNELKLNYFKEENTQKRTMKIRKIISKIEKLNLSYNKIFARLLYPGAFFDLISQMHKDDILNDETNIIKLKKYIVNYEKYLSDVYQEMKQNKKIKNVEWL